MAANAYSDSPGDYGMPDTSNGAQGPTGVPDPNNPGYDTAGYPLPGRTQPPTANVPPPNNVPVNGAPNVTQPPPSTGGGLIDVFQGAPPTFTPGTIGAAPIFTPPGYTPPPAFKDPTAAEAAAEPGYAFGLKTGLGGVEAAAAARGVLNSGGTLKDIFDYGNNAASQNYQNVDNRARSNYLTNYQTQYADPYQFAYRGAVDAFAPKMAQYNAANGASLFNAGQANTLDFNQWLQQYAIYRNRQLDSATLGAATS